MTLTRSFVGKNGVAGASTELKNYFRQGDFHDVLMIDNIKSEVIVRYAADVHTGRIMVHCHRLNHEDRGMMAQENITEGGQCSCISGGSDQTWSLSIWLRIAGGAVLVTVLAVYFIVHR
jgi:hypothetical protein